MAKKKQKNLQPKLVKRPPVVVVMGHIDHGKSTLLDTIRSSNVVESETGGITQHLSAYNVIHTTSEKKQEPLTFLDTPGHAAFQKMRLRGADVADIAILVVAADDGVKPQTLEAYKSIQEAGIPFVVAVNKIDKPGANLAQTQSSLIENEIYIEGMGGDIPWVEISALKGDGIPELLDLVVLSADLLELDADINASASGTVTEGHVDTKRGNTATLIVKEGTLKSGECIIAGNSYAPVRIMEDASGSPIKEATPGTPVGIVGFTEVPPAGSNFTTVKNKKEAEAVLGERQGDADTSKNTTRDSSSLPTIPILIKADVLGSLEAIEYEIEQFSSERIAVKIIGAEVGSIAYNDVQFASATKNSIIVGFNVPIERNAKELAEQLNVEIDTFSIIYDLTEWLETTLVEKTPKQEEQKETGKAKILKTFSVQKNTHVLGARVEEGELKSSQTVNILRRDVPVGVGKIKNLQQYKKDVNTVEEGEFGLQLETKDDIAPGDIIFGFETVIT